MSKLTIIAPALVAAFIAAGTLTGFAQGPVSSGRQPNTDIRNDSMGDNTERPGMNERITNDRDTEGMRNVNNTNLRNMNNSGAGTNNTMNDPNYRNTGTMSPAGTMSTPGVTGTTSTMSTPGATGTTVRNTNN